MPLQQGGRTRDPELVTEVAEFLYDNSRVAASRYSIKYEKNFRYLDDTVTHLFHKYEDADATRHYCSCSVFRDIVKTNGIFIRPQRDSDLCHYCESYKNIRKRLITLDTLYENVQVGHDSEEDDDIVIEEMKEEGLLPTDEFEVGQESQLLDQIKHVDIDKLRMFSQTYEGFDDERKEAWKTEFEQYEALVEHRFNKTLINDLYKTEINAPPPNTMIITMDYKQNIAIGNQTFETGATYREKSARTILGFYIVTEQSRIYVDYVSDHKNHTAWFVKCCLRDLFRKDWIGEILASEEITDCVFWSDNAGHFHNQMLMYYCLGELVYDEDEAVFENVKYKFFAANHGKSPCDSHFGKISYYYSLYTSTSENGIHTTQDLCDMIEVTMTERHQLRMSKYTNAKKKPPNYEHEMATKYYAVAFDIEENHILSKAKHDQIELQYRISIPDVKSFGYFESDKNDDIYFAHYNNFKCDPNYHMEYKTQDNDGNEYMDMRLKLKSEIIKQNPRQSVAYNLGLSYMKNSGHYIELSVNDHPAACPSTLITQKYHYSIDVLPKPIEVTKNHVEERSTDVNELLRSKKARQRVRNSVVRRST